MRELRWHQGRAWVASGCEDEEWASLFVQGPLRARTTPVVGKSEHRFAASAPPADHVVAVMLQEQNASGGSFFALLGGRCSRRSAPGLVVSVGVLDLPDTPT